MSWFLFCFVLLWTESPCLFVSSPSVAVQPRAPVRAERLKDTPPQTCPCPPRTDHRLLRTRKRKRKRKRKSGERHLTVTHSDRSSSFRTRLKMNLPRPQSPDWVKCEQLTSHIWFSVTSLPDDIIIPDVCPEQTSRNPLRNQRQQTIQNSL